MPLSWLVVGATRGIGLEFVDQLLARGDSVIATAREIQHAGLLYQLTGKYGLGRLQLVHCDVSDDAKIDVSMQSYVSSIQTYRPQIFIKELKELQFMPEKIDYVVMNAGVLHYPNVSII